MISQDSYTKHKVFTVPEALLSYDCYPSRRTIGRPILPLQAHLFLRLHGPLILSPVWFLSGFMILPAKETNPGSLFPWTIVSRIILRIILPLGRLHKQTKGMLQYFSFIAQDIR